MLRVLRRFFDDDESASDAEIPSPSQRAATPDLEDPVERRATAAARAVGGWFRHDTAAAEELPDPSETDAAAVDVPAGRARSEPRAAPDASAVAESPRVAPARSAKRSRSGAVAPLTTAEASGMTAPELSSFLADAGVEFGGLPSKDELVRIASAAGVASAPLPAAEALLTPRRSVSASGGGLSRTSTGSSGRREVPGKSWTVKRMLSYARKHDIFIPDSLTKEGVLELLLAAQE